jgi:hypothetical protein
MSPYVTSASKPETRKQSSKPRSSHSHTIPPPWLINTLPWIGTILILAGRLLFAYQLNNSAFAVSLVGDAAWIAYGVQKKLYALIVLDLMLACIDVYGIWLT